METSDPSAMKKLSPSHLHSFAAPAWSSREVRRAGVRRTAVGRRPRASQELAVLGEQISRPPVALWAMIRATASRQDWSSLSTWERKSQMVVTGSNTRSR
jgi:hypothetical protein